MTKAEWRKVIKARLGAIPPEQIRSKSLAACRRMIHTPEFQNARAVMLYLSMPGEPDLQSLAAAAWKDGKNVLLPSVDWGDNSMLPVRVYTLDARSDAHIPRVPQPAAGEPFPIEHIDLIVIPGLAFSRSGHRLGRGKGYYDRFLSRPKVSAIRAAIAFDEQWCAEFPVEPHDIGMQIIVTNHDILRIKP